MLCWALAMGPAEHAPRRRGAMAHLSKQPESLLRVAEDGRGVFQIPVCRRQVAIGLRDVVRGHARQRAVKLSAIGCASYNQ